LRFNYAHDYIINDILRHELNFGKVPAGGLDWPGARLKSAEEILLEMEKNPDTVPGRTRVWKGQPAPTRGLFSPGSCQPEGDDGEDGEGEEEQPGGGDGDLQDARGDVFDEKAEQELFPGENAQDLEQREGVLKEEAARALSMGKLMDAMKGPGRGTAPGAASEVVFALRGLYRTPWEMALQRWLEAVAPGARTFNRASRRGADRTDLVLPGRKREGWILNIVLDTSGSMTGEIPRALGAIADFCDAVSVDQLRLLQCDTAITSDLFLMPSEVAKHQISGYGGSDLSPALRHLAEDPHVEAVVVLTDGEIAYPPERMPYDVLWVLPSYGSLAFQPPYGVVIRMQAT
jgi:predicted metal-dependent peptidase